ncbi:MAG: 5-formyltetrahydrofolate cyclo-ligase [Rhodoferax sp.]|jgi:5-formyltetrahydrofolate cyclo-ligase|nr:5-formyltetrahydrofolate cyclo-ligase [Rhodoferax sp.]
MTPPGRRALRTALLERRQAVAAGVRRAWDARITEHLLRAFPIRAPLVVGFYWPMRAEFDPRPAIRAWRQAGAQAALPVVLAKGQALEFRAWWPGAPTRKAVFDLPEPQGTPVLRPDVLLMPPLGFDAAGYRLGYGGGFYDITLATMDPQPLKVGVGYELSRLDSIDPLPHDVPMDIVITEAGVFPAPWPR